MKIVKTQGVEIIMPATKKWEDMDLKERVKFLMAESERTRIEIDYRKSERERKRLFGKKVAV